MNFSVGVKKDLKQLMKHNMIVYATHPVSDS